MFAWSVLDQALKVLCCSGERYRAIIALLFFFWGGTMLVDLQIKASKIAEVPL